MVQPVDYQFDSETRCATLTFNRPQVLNAIDVATAKSFSEAVLKATSESGIRLIVIRGAGRAFVAGGDLQRFADDFDQADEVVSQLLDYLHPAILALHTTPALVLACVHGVVAGAGLSLMLVADLIMAAQGTRFILAYNRIAAAPDCGGTYFLPRRIGNGHAMQLMIGDGELDAETALRMRLIDWCVPAPDIEERLSRLIETIVTGPGLAFGSFKSLIRDEPQALLAHLERERVAFCAATKSQDFREGVSAFLQRRAAGFIGC